MNDNKVLKLILIAIIVILVVLIVRKHISGANIELSINKSAIIPNNIEFKITSNRIVDIVNPTKAIDSYSYYIATTGQKYIDIIGTIKNISDDTINIKKIIDAKLEIDGKKYDVIIDSEDKNGRDFNENEELEANQSLTCHFIIAVDKTILTTDSTLNLVLTVHYKHYNYNMKIIDTTPDIMAQGSSMNINYRGKEISGDVVKITNLCNFQILGYRFTPTVMPSVHNETYKYFAASNGKIYFDLKLQVTNLYTKAVLQEEMLGYCNLIYNDNYDFPFFKITEEDNGTNFNSKTDKTYIEPYETLTYHLICEVPENVAELNQSLYANFYIDGENYIYTIK